MNRNGSVKAVLSVKEVAEYLSVCPSTIYRLLKKSAIPAFKIGSDWRFSRDRIEKWIEQMPQGITKRGE